MSTQKKSQMDAPRYSMPTRCPVSGEPLEVTRLASPHSGVVIEGRFVPNEFALLPEQQLEFLRLFVRTRGNLKEVERLMGLSYPTIRQRLETLLKTLGYQADDSTEVERERLNQEQRQREKAAERSEILAALERGELSASEATQKLRDLKQT